MKASLFIISTVITSLAGAQVPQNGFTENKGQLRHPDGSLASEVLYYNTSSETGIFLRRDGFSYVPKKSATQIAGRIDVTFASASLSEAVAEEPYSSFFNYYLPACPDGITGVKTFRRIVYHHVFPGIDAEFFMPETGGFKYNYIVHPGANIRDIAVNINGAAVSEITPEHILLQCGDVTISEKIPYSSFHQNGRDEMLSCSYHLQTGSSGNTIRYAATVDPSGTDRIIDPWATFCGGNNTDELYGMSLAPAGTLLVSGSTFSTDFPATVGAMQDTLGGSYDAVILRTDTAGQLLWATYFGGSAYDNSYAADGGNGMLLVAGNSASADLPVGAGAYQPSNAGSYDAYLMRLDGNGQRIWATYYGSNGGEQGLSVVSDRTGHIYLGGSSTSASLPLASSGYQTSNGGALDAYIVKFDSTGIPYRATFYGGSSPEDVHVLHVDDSLQVYVTGGTFSANFPVSPGCYQNIKNGTSDIYIIKMDSTLNRRFASFYGGMGTEDAYGIATDSAGHIYIAGFTQSVDFPMLGASWQTSNTGQMELVIFRCDANGMIDWSTYYGGQLNDFTYNMKKHGDYLYITGMTESPDFQVSSNAVQDTLNAMSDAFFLKFDTAGTFIAGSFYGGQYNDNGNGIDIDDSSTVYICGNTYSANLPVSANAMQTTYGTLGDGFIAAFDASYVLSGNAANAVTEKISGNIFPNPSEKIWRAESGTNVKSYQLIDATGRMIDSKPVNATAFSINGEALPAGIYLVKMMDENGKVTLLRAVRY